MNCNDLRAFLVLSEVRNKVLKSGLMAIACQVQVFIQRALVALLLEGRRTCFLQKLNFPLTRLLGIDLECQIVWTANLRCFVKFVIDLTALFDSLR